MVCLRKYQIKAEGAVIRDIQNLSKDMISRIIKQEVIANNLANINTAGFKKDRVFQKELDSAGNRIKEDVNEVTVFQQGALRDTGNPLDLAISGDGFFTIDIDGKQYYTRDGHFYIDSTGFLRLTNSGLVMGENGPIQINGEVEIDKNGRVAVKGEEIDRIKISTFTQPYPLKKHGNTLFEALDNAEELPADNYSVLQGYVEESNVNPVEEMVRMMTTLRYFEADQRVLKTHDELLDKAANQIGRV